MQALATKCRFASRRHDLMTWALPKPALRRRADGVVPGKRSRCSRLRRSVPQLDRLSLARSPHRFICVVDHVPCAVIWAVEERIGQPHGTFFARRHRVE